MLKKQQKQNEKPVGRVRPQSTNETKSNVFSYYSSRSRVEASTGRNEPKVKPGVASVPLPRRKQLAIMAEALAIFILILFLSRLNPTVRIQYLQSNEKTFDLRSTQEYQHAADSALRSTFFNRNKFTANTKVVEAALQQQFPELAVASVSVPIFGTKPMLKLQAANPALIINTQNKLLMLDETGRAVGQASDIKQRDMATLPIVSDDTGIPGAVGKTVLPAENVDFIKQVVHQLQAKNIRIQTLSLPPLANELRMQPEGAGYYVKFNMAGDARLQAGSYLAVKERLEKDKTRPAEYIDVRVEEKAYFK